MRKIGINLDAVQAVSTEEVIELISSLGFEATFSGVMEDAKRQRRIAELLSGKGISYDTLHAPFSHINDVWKDGDAGDEMLQELTDTVDRCLEVGAPIAVVHLSSGETPPPTTDIGRGRFLSLVEYAKKKGIRLAFENQRFLFNLAWILEECRGEETVGFCWDAGHEGCFTPGKEFMPLFGDRLIALHLHDNRGIFDADDHMLPLDGALDYARVTRQIRESGYGGTMMLEVFPSASDLYRGVTPEEFFTRAANAARELIKRTDG